MTRILNIISDSNIGGAGRVLMNYLKYMDRENFSVSIVMPRGSLLAKPCRELGAKIYETDGITDKSFDRSAIAPLRAIIREDKPDIVHTHGSMSGRVAGKLENKKVVYTRHSVFPPGRLLKTAPGKLANGIVSRLFSDRIIAVSPAARDNLLECGVPEGLIDIVMNGVEPVRRATEEEKTEARRKYGVSGFFTAGILARLEEYKGHGDIVEAADILRKNGRSFKIVIAGKGPYEDELRRLISEKKLEDTVLLPGFVNDPAELLNILDVQLNASFGTEATSMALLEGMSIGLPSIASDYGGNPWVVKNNENGFIFRERTPEELASALAALMDDSALREKFGNSALSIYNESFTGAAFAKNTENVYRKVSSGGKHGKK